MEFSGVDVLMQAARRCRDISRCTSQALHRRFRRAVPGRFQPYNHTLWDRYPWLFRFAAARLGDVKNLCILSFGCSRGEEVFSLRNYFPAATIKGIDIDPRNIACCQARAREEQS